MTINKYLTTVNYNTTANKVNKYIVVHYTGTSSTTGDTALNNAKYFYSENRGASAHYFVDETSVYQVVEDYNTAWHCGTTGTYKHSECRNNNSIGIEMCCYLGSDGTHYIRDNTVVNTLQLVKQLMSQYNIPIENVIRHYDVTGKSCPAPYVDETKWASFKSGLTTCANSCQVVTNCTTTTCNELTYITGSPVATIEQLTNVLNVNNPNAISTFGNLPEFYLKEGEIEGIRGDIAFAQACLETGYFKFGGDVQASQNNFCGLGATGGGVCGNSFYIPQIGVQAHIQHLKAYANSDNLVRYCVDPRFDYVTRGVSPFVEWLGIQENPQGKGWAMDKGYGGKILGVLSSFLSASTETAPTVDLTDVSDWAKDSWSYCTEKKILDGTNPQANVTREQLACVAHRISQQGVL